MLVDGVLSFDLSGDEQYEYVVCSPIPDYHLAYINFHTICCPSQPTWLPSYLINSSYYTLSLLFCHSTWTSPYAIDTLTLPSHLNIPSYHTLHPTFVPLLHPSRTRRVWLSWPLGGRGGVPASLTSQTRLPWPGGRSASWTSRTRPTSTVSSSTPERLLGSLKTSR